MRQVRPLLPENNPGEDPHPENLENLENALAALADRTRFSAYGPLTHPPADYLIAAKGDVKAAARSAGVTEPEFYRALGSDTSRHDVTNAISMMALFNALQVQNLAKDVIIDHLDPAETEESPRSRVPFKDAVSLFSTSSKFIASMSASDAERRGPQGRVPPTRHQILEAGRGAPTDRIAGPPPLDPRLAAQPQYAPPMENNGSNDSNYNNDTYNDTDTAPEPGEDPAFDRAMQKLRDAGLQI